MLKKTNILILCAGFAYRYHGLKKQLLLVNGEDGETILSRIIRQCQDREFENTITITWDEDIKTASFSWYHPESYRTTCETVLSTVSLWNERTIILLGDVIYSRSTMDTILSYDGDIQFFGNELEIFGIFFTTLSWNEMIRCLEKGSFHRLGKLRYAYRSWAKRPLDDPEQVEKDFYHKVFTYISHINDYTQDIDAEYQYTNFIKQVVEKGRLDDVPI